MSESQSSNQNFNSNESRESASAERKLRVTLTEGAITNGYVHFPLSASIFQEANYGDGSGEKKGIPIVLVDDLGKTYKDDVRVTGNTGRLRARFGSYFSRIGARPGDVVDISKTPSGEYSMRIVRGTSFAASPISAQQVEAHMTSLNAPLKAQHMEAINTILYGPPGTGKTYSTILKAMSLVDGLEYGADIASAEYDRLKDRFDALKVAGQIEFITFHQSYGYEDFMQGIRPFTENGQVAYEVRDGVLKRIAERALQNWKRSSNDYLAVVDDESSFESALHSLQSAIETEEDQKVTMTLYGGATTKVSLRPDGKALEFAVPSTGSPWAVSIKKLRTLWPKRNEIKVPSDTGGFNSSYWWAALNLLKRHFNEAEQKPSFKEHTKPYVLVIDEINRGNISKIFGELITLVEADKRIGARYETRVTLPYADMEDEAVPFGLPQNLHFVGTMNTADRSIALLDTALRRRFQFEELMPRPELLSADVGGVNLQLLLQKLNERIELLYDRDHTIGHAYLMDVQSLAQLQQAFRHRILPLLQEYFYEDWSKVRLVLNDLGPGNFVRKINRPALVQDGDEGYESDSRPVYKVNAEPFSVDAFTRIYLDKEKG